MVSELQLINIKFSKIFSQTSATVLYVSENHIFFFKVPYPNASLTQTGDYLFIEWLELQPISRKWLCMIVRSYLFN